MHNQRAAKADEFTRFTFTDTGGKAHSVLTKEPQTKIHQTLGATVHAFNLHKNELAGAAAAKEAQAAQARLRAEEAAQDEHDLKVVQAATAAARSATAVSLAEGFDDVGRHVSEDP